MQTVDFSPIIGLLVAIIPIILIVAILGKFLKSKGIFALALVLLCLSPIAGLGLAMFGTHVMGPQSGTMAMQITPASGTLLTDIPNYFTCDGLVAATAYWVNVTVAGVTTNVVRGVAADSNGKLAWQCSFTVEGSTSVNVRTAAASVFVATYNVVNFINMLMPYVILIITLGILFGLIGMLGSLTHFGHK